MTIAIARKKKLDLATFDGRLLDGLNFCRRVYALFDQTRAGADGIANLRLRPTKLEKRLIEELIPLARYVQARYREGRRIKVRWFSGSQPYDAILLSSGAFVEKGYAPRKIVAEVTTSVHTSEYLVRELLHEQGHAFGVKGISRDRKTRAIISTPYVNTNDERQADLAARIIDRIKNKSKKGYTPDTVLIVYCVLDGVTFEDEWDEAIKRVTQADAHHAFKEVFLIDTGSDSFSATLYGDPKRVPKKDLPETNELRVTPPGVASPARKAAP
jgi:hypothetical protein